MIFVALGTHEQPFERALGTIRPLAASHELVIQHGHTPPRADLKARWLDFGSYDEILGLMREASAVACHAGVGTILSALGTGKQPIVLPRLKRYGEHVDDHQLQITKAFADRGIVIACFDGDDITACIRQARTTVAGGPARKGDLKSAVAAAAAVQGSRERRRRAWPSRSRPAENRN